MPKFTYFKVLTCGILAFVFITGFMVGHEQKDITSLGFLGATIFVVTVAYNFIKWEGLETDPTTTRKEKDRIAITGIIMLISVWPPIFALAYWLDENYARGNSTTYWYFGGLFLLWWILGKFVYWGWNRISPLR